MFNGMKYVYAVYREKSFTKAAEKLMITQPSLSASIAREEALIGHEIFNRSTKPITLTEYGRKYIQSCEKIMRVEDEFAEYVSEMDKLNRGHIIIGGTSLYASFVLPRLIAEFRSEYPNITFEIVERNTDDLIKLVDSGEIDLMLENCELPESIYSRQLYGHEHLILAVPAELAVNEKLQNFKLSVSSIQDGSFIEKKPVDIRNFSNCPFVLLKHQAHTRELADKLFKDCRISPDIVFELDQQMTSYNITAKGLGISFISSTLISQANNSSICYYRLEEKYSRRNIYFYWKSNQYRSRAAEYFTRYCCR